MEHTCFDNRELSWLKFNVRVLEEAEDETNPFCERLSFASIFQSNLDEFFGVRVGSLYDQMLVSKDIRDNKTNMTCQEQIFACFDQVKLLTQRKDSAYAALNKGMREHGVEIVTYHDQIDAKDAQFLDAYFEHEIRPLLAPQVVGKKQPFPFLKNKAIYAVVILGSKKNSKNDRKNDKKNDKKMIRMSSWGLSRVRWTCFRVWRGFRIIRTGIF